MVSPIWPKPGRSLHWSQSARLPHEVADLKKENQHELLADTSGEDVLKKTGIVVAAVATGLIGLSPLAFADDWHHHGPDKVEISEDNDTKTFEDNSINREQYNECGFI